MTLRLYNTLENRIVDFISVEPKVVGMYTCGPTVYDFAHIGNLRTYVFQDVLKRWIKRCGFNVIHVMNITDVDDKIIRASTAEGIPLKAFTQRYLEAFMQDIELLSIQKADVYPKATEHIDDMIRLIKHLLDKGYAYRGDDGSIYYRIQQFPNYGKLSKVRVDKLKTRLQVKADEYDKEHPQDFALWKMWDPSDGEVFWETELGKGRPGWHIECSAMSTAYLGETFDIHGGGVDLIFPHHENEIAQSEAATGKTFVHYWIHSEHLIVEGRKMSKSLGNYYTLRDLLSRGYSPRAIRFLLLATHYRQQVNFTFEALDAAANTLERVKDFLNRLRHVTLPGSNAAVGVLIQNARNQFSEAMNNDIDINTVLAGLFDFIKEINKLIDQEQVPREDARKIFDFILELDTILGVLTDVSWEEELPPPLQLLIHQREAARTRKNWILADKIRDELLKQGVIIEDTDSGTRWRRKTT